MMKLILFVLTAINAANGLAMVFAPQFWYAAVPGASGTGPFNPHFIPDIGIAFLAAALGLALAVRSTGAARLAVLAPAALFLGGHAVLHIVELGHHGEAVLRDTVMIVVPGLLPAALMAMSWKGATQ